MKLSRQHEHTIRLAFLGIVLTLTYLAILLPFDFLKGARLRSFDTLCRLRNAVQAPLPETNELLLVAIDDESQRRLGQKWPWDRRTHAELIRKIAAAGPRMTHLDLVFSGGTDPVSDQALALAIQAGPPVLLASYLDSNGDPVLPYGLFLEAGGLPGLINKPRDADATVRRLFAGARIPSRPQPLYAIEVLAAGLARDISPGKIRLGQGTLWIGERRVPLALPGVIPINYLADKSDIRTLSYWEVLEGRVPPETIRDKIVMIGRVASAAEIHHDVYPTSLGTMPGVLISANGILTLLSGRLLRPAPPALALGGGFLLAMGTLLAAHRLSLGMGIAATAGLAGIALGLSFLGLLLFHLEAEALSVLILAGTSWLTAVVYKHLVLAAEAYRLHRVVVTDPETGFFTTRYFRLRLDADWPVRSWARFPLTLLAVRQEKTPELLQQISWEEARRRARLLADALRRAAPHRSLMGRVEDDSLAVLLPGMEPIRATSWTQWVQGTLRSHPGRLGFGLVCTQQIPNGSWADLVRGADSAARRSWSRGNRTVESYDPAKDHAPIGQEPAPSDPQSNELQYVASELDERSRALEKALDELRRAHREMEGHFLEVTKSLVMAMETKDAYTAGHLERVSRYATRLAEELGLPAEEIEAIREAALLHDIGKMHLPDEVLHKTGPLNDEEKAVIKQHLEMGAKILDPMRFFKRITALLYHHHERYDGKGYPHGLTGEFIPAGAQVIAIADSFDAMTTNRGYNKPLKVQEALEELRKGGGTQFNPGYVESFVRVILKEGPQLAGYASAT